MVDVSQLQFAYAHDWLVGLRGGEFVLDRIISQFGTGPLYTLVNDGKPLTPAIDACPVTTSNLQRVPGAAGKARRWLLPFMPSAVDRIRVQPCDVLISTSSAVMKSIRPPAGTPHICYCHSPARYIWSQINEYQRGAGGRVRGFGLRAVRKRFQEWDRRTADRVTQFLANSTHTANLIEQCYDRDAIVVHPPVRTEFFTVDLSAPREDFLLVVAALEPYKRTDLVIEAANRFQIPLVVAGTGSHEKQLRAAAGPTVRMLGRVTNDELRDLYRRAAALVFPQEEDFGIIAVEAQACGCPVIARAKGGALDTVTPLTGRLLETCTPEAIADTYDDLRKRQVNPQQCRTNAERFSEDRFDAAMLDVVDRVLL